jgi:sec-independent protein translocase protein TatC
LDRTYLTPPTFATRAKRVPEDHPLPFLDHLDELRRRLVVSVVAFLLCSFASWFFVDRMIHFMAGFTGGFVFTQMTEAIGVRFQLSMLMGLFLTMPVLIFEAWAFIGCALEPSTRKKIGWTMPISYLLFCGGVLAAWKVVIPAASQFLLSCGTPDMRPLMSIGAFVGFAGWLTIAFGVLFQLPLVIFFLVGAGLLSLEVMAHYRRHVIVALAIIAAAVTPGPDVVSQMAVFIPTYVLYEASYWVCRLVYGNRER